MQKFNNIRKTDNFNYLVSVFSTLDYLEKDKKVNIDNLRNQIKEFAGYEMVNAYEFKKAFDVILNYSEKFFDCKENGLSYQLGCRYQKIDFDYSDNINGEISFLKALLEVYNKEFEKEIAIIKSLILDLQHFHDQFIKYDVS